MVSICILYILPLYTLIPSFLTLLLCISMSYTTLISFSLHTLHIPIHIPKHLY